MGVVQRVDESGRIVGTIEPAFEGELLAREFFGGDEWHDALEKWAAEPDRAKRLAIAEESAERKGDQVRPPPETRAPAGDDRRHRPRRKITQVTGRPRTQEPQQLSVEAQAEAGTAHDPKRKMLIIERYEWRPTGADSRSGARVSHRVKLTLECGCVVQRWKSQEPKTHARCEKRP